VCSLWKRAAVLVQVKEGEVEFALAKTSRDIEELGVSEGHQRG